jgi:hypothetical protein
MSCDRCVDIHEAQRKGNTVEECKCSCHFDFKVTCTCSDFASTTGCPEHTFTFNTQFCTSDGCSTINLN